MAADVRALRHESRVFRARDLCFLGGYMHSPNVDAVVYFVNSIFPLIRAQQPGIRFIIAARTHPRRFARSPPGRHHRRPGGGLAGFIRSLPRLCMPVAVGAGAKGKIASALSYGIPVVSTHLGVEGTEITHDKHVLIAEDPGISPLRYFAYTGVRAVAQTVEGRAGIGAERFSLQMGKAALAHAIETALGHKLGLDGGAEPEAAQMRKYRECIPMVRFDRRRDAPT